VKEISGIDPEQVGKDSSSRNPVTITLRLQAIRLSLRRWTMQGGPAYLQSSVKPNMLATSWTPTPEI
jgi:hypothetical protein